MPKVLVLDANQRSGLAIVRSLGHHGITVISGDHVANTLGGASRFSSMAVQYPDPATMPVAFIETINQLAERLDLTAVIPATDLTTMLLVSQPTLAKIVRLVTPEHASYEALTDKARMVELAGKLGIRVPTTRIARTTDEVVAASLETGFPVVLKPARSRYLAGDQVFSTSVEIVNTQGDLSNALTRCAWLKDIPCLVQEFIPGHGAGIFALYETSKAVAWFAHRRIREKPPEGGVSVLSESVRIDPLLQTISERLLSAARWSGVAMVEFRIAADGVPFLMEVNGRFWGSLQLSIDCGIDFPWLAYQLAMNERLTAPINYAVGRRLRWLLGDVDRLIIESNRRPMNLPMLGASLGSFLRTFLDPSCRQEVFRASDPGPGFQEIAQWLSAR